MERTELAVELLWRSLWQPRQLNWWIGTLFACGSLLFMLGGIFSLAPGLAVRWGLDAGSVNAVYFAGSIPFTTAAYLQLYQAANVHRHGDHDSKTTAGAVYFGWQPGDIGWLSCALQFAGTLLFNLNTFDAMLPDLDWLQQDLAIWAPDMAGSALFLISGYLAFFEYCHSWWDWQPRNLSWWITSINLLGCVAFMISAVLAFVPASTSIAIIVASSTFFTALGAAAFLTGALLMLPEANYSQ